MTPGAATARTVAPARPFAPERPLRPARPPRPRRVSGPAPARTRPGAARDEATPLALAAARAWRALASHRLLDRLIAGKAWIGLVAFALIGIVTLQLGLLELNAGIGRVLERESALQRENAALSIENSEMAAGDRVEAAAGKLGMTLVPESSLRFLRANPAGDVGHASAALNQAVHTAPAASETSSATSATGSQSESKGGEEGHGESAEGTSESHSSGAESEASAPEAGTEGSQSSPSTGGGTESSPKG